VDNVAIRPLDAISLISLNTTHGHVSVKDYVLRARLFEIHTAKIISTTAANAGLQS
jgi:hypothetical protein